MAEEMRNPFEGRVQREPIVIGDRTFVHQMNFEPDSLGPNQLGIFREFMNRGLGVIPEQQPQDRYGSQVEGLAFYRDHRLAYEDIWYLLFADPIDLLPEPLTPAELSERVEQAIEWANLTPKLQELGLA